MELLQLYPMGLQLKEVAMICAESRLTKITRCPIVYIPLTEEKHVIKWT
jgi:hypothetical protein